MGLIAVYFAATAFILSEIAEIRNHRYSLAGKNTAVISMLPLSAKISIELLSPINCKDKRLFGCSLLHRIIRLKEGLNAERPLCNR
jgi:hypothetical protein